MSSKKLTKTKNISFLNWTNRACCLMNSPLRRKVRFKETSYAFSFFFFFGGGGEGALCVSKKEANLEELLILSKGGS